MKEILYLDDNPEILELFKVLFEDEDVKIVACQQAKEAKELLSSRTFDGILLDVYLEGTDGFEVFDEVKASPFVENTPIFFISGDDSVQNQKKAFQRMCDDFILKGLDPEDLVQRVLVRIENAQKRGLSAKMTLGDLELDTENIDVYVRDKAVNLSTTEYKILLHLFRQAKKAPGVAMDRKELIKSVWHKDHESVQDKTLSTHLGAIRNKLNSHSVEIVSKRGKGVLIQLEA